MKTSPPFFLYIPILYILCQASSNPTSPRYSHSTPDPHTNPILTHIIPVIPTAPPNLIIPFIPFVPLVPCTPRTITQHENLLLLIFFYIAADIVHSEDNRM